MKGIDLADFSNNFDKTGLENLFLQLEKALTKNTAEKKKIVQEAFREVHSLKGTASFLQNKSLTDLLHSLEDLLGIISGSVHQIRGVKDPKIFDIFFEGLDLVEDLATRLKERCHFDMEESPEEPHSCKQLMANLKAFLDDPSRSFEMTALDTNLF